MKRVFTKYMGGAFAVEAADHKDDQMVDDWIPQEDIIIIGAEIWLEPHPDYVHETAGESFWEAWLTGASVLKRDGSIVETSVWEGIDAGTHLQHLTYNHVVVMFPEGYGVPVREGEHLNLLAEGNNDGGETVEMDPRCLIYYVKGKATT